MEETTSVHWKAVAFIRAFTLSRMLEIKTGVNSLSLLCLWKMVVLVGILMLNRLPLIGGEPGVQIPILIHFDIVNGSEIFPAPRKGLQ